MREMLREIVPGVLTWPWFSERFGYDFNGYLVRQPGGNIVIDPVEMPDAVLEAIAREGAAVIAITNRNHFRAAARVRERTGARVLAPPLDAPFVQGKGVPVAGDLIPTERLGPFTVIALPGKSPGEVALHWPERRLLVVGDACVGKAPGVLGLLPAAVMDRPDTLQQSLRELAARIEIDTLLVCDGHPILDGAGAALGALVATFDAPAA